MTFPVYRLPEKSAKKDFINNMFGSAVNAAISVVLLVVVSHLLGRDAAGVFTLAYSTAQMMYTVGAFEMRNAQVTDAKREFSFGSLLGFRIITVLLMWAASAIFILIRGYTGEKALLIAIVCVYMSILALADLFQGNLHLNGYLRVAGRSLACIVLLAAAAFSATLYFTRNLVVSALPMVAVALLWVFLHDVPYSRNFSGLKPDFAFKNLKAIFLCALPLFLSAFLNQFIFNAPKYAIDTLMSEADQAVYGYLVMPAFVINLLSIFAFRPQLVSLSESWVRGEYDKFKRTSMILYLWIGVVTVAALGAGALFGLPVLGFLYGADLEGMRGTLLILLTAGCFSASATLALTLFTTMRKQRLCLIAYGITTVFSLAVPQLLVARLGVTGAALSYLAETALLFAAMASMLVAVFRKARKNPEIKHTEE
ncbi:MAG: lipopolysaccharide biosynthesis protein [Clostridia bacterium]|nr:lipopolysaccharide biosynthesis protein [Clostridia bacterium]